MTLARCGVSGRSESIRYEPARANFFWGAYFRLSDFQSANFAQIYACAGTPTLFLAGQLAGYNLTSPGPTAPGNGVTAPDGAKHVIIRPSNPLYEYFIYTCTWKSSSLPIVISQCGEVDKA